MSAKPQTIVIVSPEGQRMTIPYQLLRTYEFNGWKRAEEKDAYNMQNGEKYDFTQHNLNELRIFADAAGVKWRGVKKAELILQLIEADYKPPMAEGDTPDGPGSRGRDREK